jgi:ABC-type transport system involved in multi-copper enzyme maturation permease subunit
MNVLSIFKIELKKNFGSILKISLMVSLFMLMILYVFDPELFSGMEDMFSNYPQEILDMLGGVVSLSTLAGFITMEFLAIIWMWVGIYIILKAAQDIPTAIDNKTIDLLLSKPIKRWEYALGKQLRFIFSLLFIFASMLFVIAVMVPILPNLADEELVWKEFIAAFFWAFLFCLCLESTAFLLSTFMPRKKASGAAFVFLILFLIIGQYYSYFDESLQNMRYLSIFNYYDPARIMIEHSFTDVGRDFAVLIIYSVVATAIAIIVFNKRDIPV